MLNVIKTDYKRSFKSCDGGFSPKILLLGYGRGLERLFTLCAGNKVLDLYSIQILLVDMVFKVVDIPM